MDVLDAIAATFGSLVSLGGLVWMGLRLMRMSQRGSEFKPEQWQNYADERGWQLRRLPGGGRLVGAIDGQPVTASVEVERYVRSKRGQVPLQQTVIRVPVRGAVPLFTMRRRSVKNKARLALSTERLLGTGDPALDALVLISGPESDPVAELVRQPPVAQAMITLFRNHPEVVANERSIELVLDGVESRAEFLDGMFERMTALAAAIEGFVPQIDGKRQHIVMPGQREVGGQRLPAPPSEPAAIPLSHPAPAADVSTFAGALAASSTASAAPTAPSKPVEPPPPELQLKPLYLALRSIKNMSLREQMSAVHRLRLPPYEYTLEVRSVSQQLSRLGRETGRVQLNGVLQRENWRLELAFEVAQADEVLSLVAGDVVRGRCLLEDVVAVRRAVMATADGPIEVVHKNTAKPNTSGQDRSGTGGGSPT